MIPMIPCKDCLKLPMCKHKEFFRLMIECKDLFAIFYYSKTGGHKKQYSKNLEELEKIMRWGCEND